MTNSNQPTPHSTDTPAARPNHDRPAHLASAPAPPQDPAGLLQAILPRLDRGDAADARFPDSRGEYWALCPFHPDRHATNFSVSRRGYKCFACGAQGSLHHLAQELGFAGLQRSQGGKHTPPSPP